MHSKNGSRNFMAFVYFDSCLLTGMYHRGFSTAF